MESLTQTVCLSVSQSVRSSVTPFRLNGDSRHSLSVSISSHRAPDRQTDRRTDRQTDRQTRMRYSCVYRRHTLHSEAIFEVKEVALSREVVSREGGRERETRKRLRDCSKQSRDVLSFLDYAVCFMIVFEVAAFSIETPTLQTERDLCLRDTRPDDRCLGKTSSTLWCYHGCMWVCTHVWMDACYDVVYVMMVST